MKLTLTYEEEQEMKEKQSKVQDKENMKECIEQEQKIKGDVPEPSPL